MVRKTDSPNTRRLHFMHRGILPKHNKSALKIFAEIGATPKDLSLMWDAAARQAVQLEKQKVAFFAGTEGPTMLSPDFSDITIDSLTRAFAHFNLDPGDPGHWRLLLNYFAYIHFGKRPRKKIEPAKWSPAVIGELKAELEARKFLGSEPAAARAAALIIRDRKSKFYGTGKEMLRKKIGELRRAERQGVVR